MSKTFVRISIAALALAGSLLGVSQASASWCEPAYHRHHYYQPSYSSYQASPAYYADSCHFQQVVDAYGQVFTQKVCS